MAKKKHQNAGTGANGQGAGGGSEQPADKTQAVKAALRDGLKSPTEIANHVRTKYGMAITPNYVSVIKGKMKRSKKRKGKGKRSQAGGQALAAPAHAVTGAKRGLSPEDIVELADLARKAGGYEKLQKFLNALNSIK